MIGVGISIPQISARSFAGSGGGTAPQLSGSITGDRYIAPLTLYIDPAADDHQVGNTQGSPRTAPPTVDVLRAGDEVHFKGGSDHDPFTIYSSGSSSTYDSEAGEWPGDIKFKSNPTGAWGTGRARIKCGTVLSDFDGGTTVGGETVYTSTSFTSNRDCFEMVTQDGVPLRPAQLPDYGDDPMKWQDNSYWWTPDSYTDGGSGVDKTITDATNLTGWSSTLVGCFAHVFTSSNSARTHEITAHNNTTGEITLAATPLREGYKSFPADVRYAIVNHPDCLAHRSGQYLFDSSTDTIQVRTIGDVAVSGVTIEFAVSSVIGIQATSKTHFRVDGFQVDHWGETGAKFTSCTDLDVFDLNIENGSGGVANANGLQADGCSRMLILDVYSHNNWYGRNAAIQSGVDVDVISGDWGDSQFSSFIVYEGNRITLFDNDFRGPSGTHANSLTNYGNSGYTENVRVIGNRFHSPDYIASGHTQQDAGYCETAFNEYLFARNDMTAWWSTLRVVEAGNHRLSNNIYRCTGSPSYDQSANFDEPDAVIDSHITGNVFDGVKTSPRGTEAAWAKNVHTRENSSQATIESWGDVDGRAERENLFVDPDNGDFTLTAAGQAYFAAIDFSLEQWTLTLDGTDYTIDFAGGRDPATNALPFADDIDNLYHVRKAA